MLELVIVAGVGISSPDETEGWGTGVLVLGTLVISLAVAVRFVCCLEAWTELRRFRSELDSWETGRTTPASLVQTGGVRVTASDEALEVIGNSGGLLFVWPLGFALYRTLKASCEPPRGALEFRRLTAGGFLLFLHPALHRLPSEFSVELRGRRHRRIAVYWDGLVYLWV